MGRATAGNLLFLEEMLRMLIEDGVLVERDALAPHGGRLVARAGIGAGRPAARLDLLEPEELAVLQRAAVMGQVFLWGAVAELTPAETGEVFRLLQALVRKQLIRPDRRSFVGEDGFRFGHILIRDAVRIDAETSGAARAVRRLGRDARGERTDLDEIIGHHLEQAYRYRVELGRPVVQESELATRLRSRSRAPDAAR